MDDFEPAIDDIYHSGMVPGNPRNITVQIVRDYAAVLTGNEEFSMLLKSNGYLFQG